MICLARITLPPKTWPIAWWPRHTPKIGISPASSRSTSSDTPASSGVPGPGEIMMCDGFSARMPATSSASLRTTFTCCPSSPRYCTRLKVKLS